MSARPDILVATPLAKRDIACFSRRFSVTYRPDLETERTVFSKGGPFRAILTRSKTVIGETELSSLPNLELVVALGSGTDAIDAAALRRHGVKLVTGRGVNAACVADHAFALMLGLLRNLRELDVLVRDHGPVASCASPRSVGGRRLGIVGLGAVGMEIAWRAETFRMAIAYNARNVRRDVDWPFHANVRQLAADSDVLVLCCPGGESTRHLMDAETLDALGPQGLLVNVARGSVVDTSALADALETASIAGAALDVVDATPKLFARLKACETLCFSPHTAGRSPETHAAAISLGLEHLEEHFFGRGSPS